MAEKKRTLKGPPAKAQKWLEEQRQGKHKGQTPTAAHANSIWDTSCIPERYKSARPRQIADAEKRLGVVVPTLLAEQVLIQNGGYLAECDEFPFEESVPWTNATVDGIDKIESWARANDDHWFDSVEDVESLDLLIRIAAHSESQLCLDYRDSGKSGPPGIAYVDVCREPTEVTVITGSVDEFVQAIVSAKSADDND